MRLAVFLVKLLYAVAYVMRASGAFPQLPVSAAVSARRPRGSALRLRLRRVVIYAPFGFGPVVSAAALGLGDRFQGSTSRFQNADILPKHRHSVNREFLQIPKPPRNRLVCRMRRRGISRLDNTPMPALIHGDSPCATWGQSPRAARKVHDILLIVEKNLRFRRQHACILRELRRHACDLGRIGRRKNKTRPSVKFRDSTISCYVLINHAATKTVRH